MMKPISRSYFRPLVWLVISVCIVLTLLAAANVTFVDRDAPAKVSRTTSEVTTEPVRVHGSSGDALDLIPGTGLSLEDAVRKTGLQIALPKAAAVGEPVRIALDETGADAAGRPGLMVLYDSGIKLKVAAGELDYDAVLSMPAAPFTDRRASPFVRQVVAGRSSLVLQGGTQDGGARGALKVLPRIMWNMNGMTYTLEAGSDEVSVGALVSAASSIQANANEVQ